MFFSAASSARGRAPLQRTDEANYIASLKVCQGPVYIFSTFFVGHSPSLLAGVHCWLSLTGRHERQEAGAIARKMIVDKI
jgi:hypothetical protein